MSEKYQNFSLKGNDVGKEMLIHLSAETEIVSSSLDLEISNASEGVHSPCT